MVEIIDCPISKWDTRLRSDETDTTRSVAVTVIRKNNGNVKADDVNKDDADILEHAGRILGRYGTASSSWPRDSSLALDSFSSSASSHLERSTTKGNIGAVMPPEASLCCAEPNKSS